MLSGLGKYMGVHAHTYTHTNTHTNTQVCEHACIHVVSVAKGVQTWLDKPFQLPYY